MRTRSSCEERDEAGPHPRGQIRVLLGTGGQGRVAQPSRDGGSVRRTAPRGTAGRHTARHESTARADDRLLGGPALLGKWLDSPRGGSEAGLGPALAGRRASRPADGTWTDSSVPRIRRRQGEPGPRRRFRCAGWLGRKSLAASQHIPSPRRRSAGPPGAHPADRSSFRPASLGAAAGIGGNGGCPAASAPLSRGRSEVGPERPAVPRTSPLGRLTLRGFGLKVNPCTADGSSSGAADDGGRTLRCLRGHDDRDPAAASDPTLGRGAMTREPLPARGVVQVGW